MLQLNQLHNSWASVICNSCYIHVPYIYRVQRIWAKEFSYSASNSAQETTDAMIILHVHVYYWMLERCGRKEERSKQGHTNNKAKQHNTPKAVTFPKKNGYGCGYIEVDVDSGGVASSTCMCSL